jgi:TetR/AcrR family transcriptional repressor of nem operon
MPRSASVRPAKRRTRETAERILDVAGRLTQTKGFNGFSYADVAERLGITKASLHYHFPTKAKLGEALIARYSARFAAAFAHVDRSVADAPGRLAAYAELYGRVLRAERMCLCGMLAAEQQTLPEVMRQAVRRFFDDQEAWLVRVLDQGRVEGTVRFPGSAGSMARAILSGLEGAMLLARSYRDPERFRAAVEGLLAPLGVDPPERRSARPRARSRARLSATLTTGSGV